MNYFRQSEIEDQFMFTCNCERCLDPSEFGTFYGGICCESCESGLCVPTNPANFEADWACSGCKAKFAGGDQLGQLKFLSRNIDEAIADSQGAVQTLEFVSTFSSDVCYDNSERSYFFRF